ncbi:MAG: hypothetical protein WAL32_07515 [Terriglobales bacterium]
MSFPAADRSTIAASDSLTSSAISHQLHQTAQPLTVLQGLLELALLSSRTTEEYRDAIQRAMEQSRRISGCFDLVRRLFHFHQSALDVSTFSVSDMARAAVKSVSDSYAIAGIECVFHPLSQSNGYDVVTASEGNISAALALILSNLPRWTSTGGSVKVAIDADFHHVLVRIQARKHGMESACGVTPELGTMAAPLHLARTMVTSTGGKITQYEPEFSVLISLAKTPQNPEMYETQRIESVHV